MPADVLVRVGSSASLSAWRPGMERIAVSIEEARYAIGIGRTKIYELIKEGRLKTFKLGRRTLIKVESIRSLIADAS